MQRIIAIVLLSLTFFYSAQAQIGGRRNFEFLQVPGNARLAGVGRVNVSLHQADPNVLWQNPALIDSSSSRKLGFNYTPYFADIKNTHLSYVHHVPKVGTFGAGLQYMAYGSFTQTNPNGQVTGTFVANDFAFNIGYAHRVKYFRMGASLKFIGSQIETYNSTAIAADIAGAFIHPKYDWTIGLVFKNIGIVLSDYNEFTQSRLPFEVQLGTSFKPKHMPFRFSLTLQQMQQFDITYLDPLQDVTFDANNGNTIPKEKNFGDNLLRHFVIGGEFLPEKVFSVRLGYNHLINRELRETGASRFSGFSYGFRIRVKALEFAFSRATYHAAGGRNFLSLYLDFNRVLKKRTVTTSQ
jgi:hypothetical protein